MCFINPNYPKSFKILYMLLYEFGGFRLVECSYRVFTWGSMSQFCLSTKSVNTADLLEGVVFIMTGQTRHFEQKGV